jgi:hypothetical protein
MHADTTTATANRQIIRPESTCREREKIPKNSRHNTHRYFHTNGDEEKFVNRTCQFDGA